MSHSRGKKRSGFVVQGTILAGASVLVRVIGLIYRIPLTNIIGDEGNALYSVAFEVYSIALLLSSYSLPLAVSKLVSIRVAKRELTNAYRVWKGAMVFSILVGALIAILVFLQAEFIADTIMKAPLSSYALKVLAPCLFIVAVLGVIRGYCQGIGTTIPTAISQVLEQVVNAIVSIVAASILFQMGAEVVDAEATTLLGPAYGAAGGTLGTVVGAFFALAFMTLIFVAYRPMLKKQLAREHDVEVESYSNIYKVLFLTIIPVVLSTAVYNISTVLDQGIYNNLMLAQGYSEAEYLSLWGIYTGKFRVLQNVPLGVTNAFATAVIPSIAAAVAAKNRKEAHKKINLAIRLSMIIGIPCAVAFLMLGSPILILLFGDSRTTSALIMALGSVSVVCYCLSTVSNAILQATDHMAIPLRNAAISLVVHLLALYLMLGVFKWGIYAVIASNIVFSLLMCILNSLALKKRLRFRQEKKKTFIIPAVSSLIMGTIALILIHLFELFMPQILATLLVFILAILMYGLLMVVLGGVTEKDLYEMPKGAKIAGILRKMRILHADMID